MSACTSQEGALRVPKSTVLAHAEEAETDAGASDVVQTPRYVPADVLVFERSAAFLVLDSCRSRATFEIATVGGPFIVA